MHSLWPVVAVTPATKDTKLCQWLCPVRTDHFRAGVDVAGEAIFPGTEGLLGKNFKL